MPTIYKLECTAEELQQLASMIDVAIKATGVQGAKIGLPWIDKIEQVVAQANAEKE